jgi:hypothetical protein
VSIDMVLASATMIAKPRPLPGLSERAEKPMPSSLTLTISSPNRRYAVIEIVPRARSSR